MEILLSNPSPDRYCRSIIFRYLTLKPIQCYYYFINQANSFISSSTVVTVFTCDSVESGREKIVQRIQKAPFFSSTIHK